MGYFPFFADLNGMDILLTGNGPKAQEKAEKLAPFGARLRRVDTFDPTLLEPRPALVIAAEENKEANRQTALCCRTHHIPVNAVDDRDFCGFIFPAVLTAGKLTVGISTGGASPMAAVIVREQLEEMLGDHFDEILTWLEDLRPRMAAAIPDPAERKSLWRTLCSRAMALDRPLTADELEEIMKN